MTERCCTAAIKHRGRTHEEFRVARREAVRKWRSDKGSTWDQKYRTNHPTHWQDWYRKNREKGRLGKRVIEARRRARKAGAAGVASTVAILARVAFYGGCCWMCKGAYEALDHVIPLARGGTGWPANLRPICQSCNSRKGAKLVRELI